MKNQSVIGLLVLTLLCIGAITALTVAGKPVPELISYTASASLAGLLGLSIPGGQGKQAVRSGEADDTGPADDIEPDAFVIAVESAIPPPLRAAAPELAGNIVAEARRVLKRGIKL